MVAGVTLVDPLAVAKVPAPLSMAREVVFCVVQVSFDVCPALIESGTAVNVTLGRAGFTVIVTVPDFELVEFVAVIVYVVVESGETVAVPLKPGAPSVTLGDIVTEVAFVADQVMVARSPELMVILSAVNVTAGVSAPPPLPPGAGLEVEAPPEPQPVAIKIIARANSTARRLVRGKRDICSTFVCHRKTSYHRRETKL